MYSFQKWKSFDFGEQNQNKKNKPHVPSDLNFFKKLEPCSVSDLAVHAKKVREVETWLQLNVVLKRHKVSETLN